MKRIIKLNSKDIKSFSKEILKMKEKFNAKNEILKALAKFMQEEIDKNISNTQFEDGTHDLKSIYEEKADSIVVGMRGTQSVYDEFGTGTEGASNQHPMKSGTNLNAYNSGSTIRKANSYIADLTGIPQGELYWTYIGQNGEKNYTTGIPAGKQVYNAYLSMQKEKKNIIMKKGRELLSKQ